MSVKIGQKNLRKNLKISIWNNFENLYPKIYNYNLVGRQSNWDLWLGISDELQEGIWLAADGSGPITFTNWNSGEPNNVFGGTEHWGEMDLVTAGWNDYVAASDPKERLNISNENKVICTFVVPKKC